MHCLSTSADSCSLSSSFFPYVYDISKGGGLGSPLAACLVYRDLIGSVHTINNFCSVSNYQTHAGLQIMRICVFHSNLNVKNSIIFGNVRIMYEKNFPDTQLCPVSKRICFVFILMECGLLPIFP